jgi:hypothetical protein
MTCAEEVAALVVAALVDRIRALLADHPPEVQGIVLADLLAIWLAGHYIPDDSNATREERDDLLANHCAMVRKLVPVNARALRTTP